MQPSPPIVRFGVVLPQDGQDSFAPVAEFAKKCEEMGYYSVYTMDHLLGFADRIGGLERPIFECLTTISALSTITQKIRFGVLTICNSYRNPALLAKVASSIDVISNGRLEFGIGAGWWEDEHSAYGFEFPKISNRIARLEEAVKIVKLMWTEERASFQGRFYRISNAICNPKPAQKPYPPIIIGGTGEKLTFSLVARFAEMCNFGRQIDSPEAYREKAEILEERCREVGRDPATLAKTWLCMSLVGENEHSVNKLVKRYSHEVNRFRPDGVELDDYLKGLIVGTPDECVEKLRQYVKVGVTYFMLYFPDVGEGNSRELFASSVMNQFI